MKQISNLCKLVIITGNQGSVFDWEGGCWVGVAVVMGAKLDELVRLKNQTQT